MMLQRHSTCRDIQTACRQRVIPGGAQRFGLVVGLSCYRDSRLNLPCARSDAEAVHALMVDPGCGLFPQANVALLVDAAATRDALHRALARLCRQAGPEDTVWIYYAGHGAQEGSRGYWVPHEADVDDLRGTGFSNQDLAGFLDDIASNRLLVLLDCCHAAATAMRRNATRSLFRAEDIFGGLRGKGRLTMTASEGREKSVELSDAGQGAFTHFLVRGLRGEADANGDGVVTADELWRYLDDRVGRASRAAGCPQTPVLIGELTHEFALTLNPLATAARQRLADAVEALIGLGEDKLTTDEAELVLHWLRCGPVTADARALEQEVEALVAGRLGVPTFRRLLRTVREQEPPRALPSASATSPSVWGSPFSEFPGKPVVRKPKPVLQPFTTVAAVRESQRVWQEYLNCPLTFTDAHDLEFVLVPPGLMASGGDNGTESEWIPQSEPFWITRASVEARQLKTLFREMAEGAYGKFSRLVISTGFLHRGGAGCTVSAADILCVCEYLSVQTQATYRLPSELEWEAAVGLFAQPTAEDRMESCLGVVSRPRVWEWTGSPFAPWRDRACQRSVPSGLRTALVMRRTGDGERKSAGSATPIQDASVHLVKAMVSR